MRNCHILNVVKLNFQVDNNVTRHLNGELNSEDWDVLLLHYLGLDHIGHLAGPRSPLVKPKLEEMDSIIKQIYISMLEKVLSAFNLK